MSASTETKLSGLGLIRTLLLEEIQRAAEILADQAQDAYEELGTKGILAATDASATFRDRLRAAGEALDSIGWTGADRNESPVPIPTGPEDRARWRRDPAEYEARERLHDAANDLGSAVEEFVDALGVSFDARYAPDLLPDADEALHERLTAARERVAMVQAQWTAALARAEALFDPEGGE